ncbi:MAG TPA: cysteine desulfurase family protein [Armatimonadota bacterium]|nr:cysteine desulfurase family protein [Armatimonadota bacterium]
MNLPVYLDYNATTPLAPEVVEAIQPCLGTLFGNPSSPHAYGIAARRSVEAARAQVAAMLGCAVDEVVFTSGGTEASNTAIKGVALAGVGRGRHLITAAAEHPATLEPCAALAAQGWEVTVLPVDGHGRVRPEDVAAALRPDTVLVSIMHANNEVGTLQPIVEIAALAHAAGALLHTDAAQTVGKAPVRVDALGADLVSIAGHKFYAPKGVGALYVRRGVTLAKFMHGAGHEANRRASTENLLGIVALGAACRLVAEHLAEHAAHLRAMRDRLWARLAAEAGDVRLHGHPEERLPNTLSVGFRGLDATDLLAELYDDVAVSAGSACHSSEVSISPVLRAMRVPEEYARGTLRFSVGRMTTGEEVDYAAAAVVRAVRGLRR